MACVTCVTIAIMTRGPGESLPIIYRLFDNEGRLLYVGRTTNLHQRLREHRGKHWWASVTRGSFEFAEDPVADEWVAITTEQPLMNGTSGAVPIEIPATATPAERQRALTRERVRRYRQRQRQLRDAVALHQDKDSDRQGQAVTGKSTGRDLSEDEWAKEWGSAYPDDAA